MRKQGQSAAAGRVALCVGARIEMAPLKAGAKCGGTSPFVWGRGLKLDDMENIEREKKSPFVWGRGLKFAWANFHQQRHKSPFVWGRGLKFFPHPAGDLTQWSPFVWGRGLKSCPAGEEEWNDGRPLCGGED